MHMQASLYARSQATAINIFREKSFIKYWNNAWALSGKQAVGKAITNDFIWLEFGIVNLFLEWMRYQNEWDFIYCGLVRIWCCKLILEWMRSHNEWYLRMNEILEWMRSQNEWDLFYYVLNIIF